MPYVNAFSEVEDLGDGEEPWCDLVFDMVDARVMGRKRIVGNDSRTLSGSAFATTPRGTIGFGFRTAPVFSWVRRDHDDVPLAWGKVILNSLGEPTDRLITEYSAWFNLGGAERRAVNEIECPTVALGHDATEIFGRAVQMKLFFESSANADAAKADGPGEANAELFFNVDFPNARVELKEKDPEYRAPLVAWLSGEHPLRIPQA